MTYPEIWQYIKLHKSITLVVENPEAENKIKRCITYAKRDDLDTISSKAIRLKSSRKIVNGKIELTFVAAPSYSLWL